MGTGVRNDYPGKGHRSDLEAGFGTRRRLPRGAEVCAALHELSSRRSRRRRRDSGRSHRRSCGVYAGRPTQPSLQTARPAAFSAGSATLNACTIIDVRSSQHRNARSRLRPMSTAFAPHRRAASRECNSVQRTELQTVAPRRADERTVGNLVPALRAIRLVFAGRVADPGGGHCLVRWGRLILMMLHGPAGCSAGHGMAATSSAGMG